MDAAHNLSRVLFHQKNYVAAAAQARQVLAARRRILPTNHPSTLATAQGLFESLMQLKQFDQAEGVLRDVLSATENPLPAAIEADLSFQLGQLCIRQNELRDAIEPLQHAIEMRERLFAGSWQASEARSLLGETWMQLGELEKGEDLLNVALARLEALPINHGDIVDGILKSTRNRIADLHKLKNSREP